MMATKRTVVSLVLVGLFSLFGSVSVFCDEQPRQQVLFDFNTDFDIRSVVANDAKVALSQGEVLRVETGHEEPWPGVTLKAPAGRWNLSRYEQISMDVNNLTENPVTVYCRVDNPGADGTSNCITDSILLGPGAAGILTVRIFPSRQRLSEELKLVGMRGFPVHSGKVDTSNITQLIVFVTRPNADQVFEVDNIRADGLVEVVDAKTFLPFKDEFGQYIHADWPGKTHSVEELITRAKAEEKDLTENPGPKRRNQYGGWTAGPILKATGFFRIEKYGDKWWLVDPQGQLFWSHGIDCVHGANPTPISDREHYFRDLPGYESPFAKFYDTGVWAPHGYYKDHSPYKTYDFTGANLLRKYGQDRQRNFAEITHRRLRSWGLNTIANWSQADIYLMRKTPYVATISYSAKVLEGSTGYWGKFFDVFDPGFREALRKRLEGQKGRSVDDPWCIGYFVHNELSWGDEVSLAIATLASPAEQPAKKVFVEDLSEKYKTIGASEKLA